MFDSRSITLLDRGPLEAFEDVEREITALAPLVFEYLARNPGARAGEIAAGLSVAQGVVSAQLHRGRDRWFSTRTGRWYPVPAADFRKPARPPA